MMHTYSQGKLDMFWLCCREAILDALSPLAVGKESGVAGGEGAIYFWAKLPSGTNAVLEWCHHTFRSLQVHLPPHGPSQPCQVVCQPGL